VDSTLNLAVPSAEAAADAALAVRDAVPVAALEVLAPGAGLPGGQGWRLLVRLHGNALAVADLAERALRAAAPCGARPGGSEPAQGIWAGVARLGADAPLLLRLAGPPAALRSTLALAEDMGEAAGLGANDARALAAHALTGVVRLWGAATRAGDGRLAAALDDARAALAGQGGTVSVARAPAALAARVEAFADPGPPGRLMRELRRAFDPAGILSAGRWVV
jgi:hypothetical protein